MNSIAEILVENKPILNAIESVVPRFKILSDRKAAAI